MFTIDVKRYGRPLVIETEARMTRPLPSWSG
jgi:hypothetical protein